MEMVCLTESFARMIKGSFFMSCMSLYGTCSLAISLEMRGFVLCFFLCMAISTRFSLHLPSLSFVLCMVLVSSAWSLVSPFDFAWSLVSNLSWHI